MIDPPPAVRTSVCGALGAYDPEVVSKISQSVGPGLKVVHEDRRSILALDRPAIAWSAPGRRGLAWAEHPCHVNATALRSWQDAAAAGTCGLVVSGRDRFVHP